MGYQVLTWITAGFAAMALTGRLGVAADAALDDATRHSILTALEDERHNQALYARVLKDHENARPFANVVRAERRHAEFLVALLQGRGLPVPENPWANAELPAPPASLREACAAAAESEVKNVALYDRALVPGLPQDVRRAFEHNRMASFEHHKPAFERCAGVAPAGRPAGATPPATGE